MATPQSGTSLDAIATLLKLFQGEKTKTTETGGGFTETSKVTPNQDALVAILKSALESNQGLASVAQGQKTAGLYNSSTNRLLSNDLLSRLSGQAAIAASQGAGAEKTVTRTGTPATRTQVQGGMGGDSNMLSKLMLAGTAYNKLSKDPYVQKGMAAAGTALSDLFAPSADMGSATVSMMDGAPVFMDAPMFSANSAISNVTESGFGSGLDSLTQIQFADTAQSFVDPIMQLFSSQEAADTTAAVAEETGNFLTASQGSTGANLSSGNTAGLPTASEISSQSAASADTTSLSNTADAATAAGGAAHLVSTGSTGLGTAASGISYGANTSSSLGSLSTGYDLGSGLDAAGGTSDVLAGSAGSGAASTGGSILGYIGPVMSAIGAQRNPEGVHGKDYRHAVGSAVLNYFGWGWAAPIVHKVAEPVLNAAMDAGEESLGMFGAVLADPVGAPLSGEYKVEDLVQSTLDPGNIFGGNPGGSVGALVGASVDPVGAALGDKGVFSVVSDSVNSVDKAIGGALGAPGRVVCTELALGGELPIEKYQRVIQPDITLKGRILLGYHVLGVPAVRKLRKDKRFRERALPYVNAYLDHKLGKWNWRGFLIKSIGEPLCWCLSFFNKDPDYYQTLYPYRRVRNG